MHSHPPRYRSSLQRITWLLPILAGLLLAACSGGHEVAYACGGSATDATVSYVGEDGATVEETVTIPWEQTIERGGNDFGVRLEAENLGDSGDLACRVSIDGREMANTTWEETVSIAIDYSKSGNSVEWSSSTSGTARAVDLEHGLEVRNLGTTPVCAFYAVPATESGWGVNHFAGQSPVEGGSSFVIPDFVEGTYNVKVVDCEGNIPAWQFQVDLAPGTWVSVDPIEDNPTLTLLNNSSQDICGLYMEHPAVGTLPNLFSEGSTVPVGSSILIVMPQDVTRLTAEPCQGSGAAVLSAEAGGPPATWEITDELLAGANLISLEVINDSPNALCGAYLTAPNQPWGTNRFPAGTRLENGQSYTITNLVAQNYDLKTVTCDGDIPSLGINEDYVSLAEQYGTTLRYTVSGVPNTVVQNHSSLDICGVAIAPTGTTDWLRNLLDDGQPIQPGEEFSLFVPGSQFDLQVTACSGQSVVAPDQPVPDGYTFEVVD
jgi:hypothetical protein